MKLVILAFSLAMSLNAKTRSDEFKIVLPPEPDPILNDTTIHGIDANKNGVRDDIEIYLYKNVTQDWNLFNAYLQSFRNEHDMIKHLNNKLKFYKIAEQDRYDSNSCIQVFDSKVTFGPYARIRLFYNSDARKKIGAQISNGMRTHKIKRSNVGESIKNCKFKVKK